MSEALVIRQRALLAYADDVRAFHPGHHVLPLRSGREAFPAMIDAIRKARHQVLLETYILRSDRIGQLFADALIERAQAGVHVRLMFDAFGSLNLDTGFVAKLEKAGVEVLSYRPMVPWRRRWGLVRRDHRKILVVDDEVAFTGGLNLGNEYADTDEGGGGWHDMHVRVRGPIVGELSRLFRRTWKRAGGTAFVPRERSLTPPPGSEGALVRVLDNDEFLRRTEIRRAYLHAIDKAQSSIVIVNAYFVPDVGVRWALRRACRRGVSVRIIVPARFDVAGVKHASRHLFGHLLDAGVRLFEWPGPMMHAKTMVVDGVWVTIGSYNLNYRSLLHDLEVGVAIIDDAVGGHMLADFEADVATCTEIQPVQWKDRPWWQKALEWFFYQFKRYM